MPYGDDKSVMAFGTLPAARELRAGGAEPEQAEAHAKIVAAAVHGARGDLVTKVDPDAAIAGLENRMSKIAVDMAVGQVAPTAVLIKFLI